MKVFSIDNNTFLREMAVNDATELYALIANNRAYLREWLPWVDEQQAINDALEFIEDVKCKNQVGAALTLAIVHADRIIGVIGFHEFDKINKQTAMGYWISANQQGKGIITKSCSQLIDFAFNDLHLNKVIMRIAKENIKSRRVAERLGLVIESISQQSEWLYDHFVDHVNYSILMKDWLAK